MKNCIYCHKEIKQGYMSQHFKKCPKLHTKTIQEQIRESIK